MVGAMFNRRIELNRSAGEVFEILSRQQSSPGEFEALLSGNDVLFSARQGAWWRPKIRASISPLSQGSELNYRLEPDFPPMGLWLVFGIALLLFGSMGVMAGLESAEVADKYGVFWLILVAFFGLYGALTCWLAWDGCRDVWPLLERHLALGHIRALQREAATLLQRCAERAG